MRSKLHRYLAACFVLFLLLPAAVHGQQNMVLVETGSSMPEPLYKNWIDAFHKQQPSTEIRYMAVGSAESARNILAGSGDFGVAMRRSPKPSFATGGNRFWNYLSS